MPARGARVEEVDVISSTWPARTACWWGAACNIPRSIPPRALGVPGFQLAGATVDGEFTITRFRATAPVALNPTSWSATARRDPQRCPAATDEGRNAPAALAACATGSRAAPIFASMGPKGEEG